MDARNDNSARYVAVGALLVIVAGTVTLGVMNSMKVSREQWMTREMIFGLAKLKAAEHAFMDNDLDKNGRKDYWTGDITGLYRLGLIPRELAEADAAPLVPLVDKARPYMGFYFVAMEALDKETALKKSLDPASGTPRHDQEFGFCAYPADPTSSPPKYQRDRSWMITSGGLFNHHRVSGPILRFPEGADREGLVIVD